MSDGMGREPAYLSSHATNRYFIPNWGKAELIKTMHANGMTTEAIAAAIGFDLAEVEEILNHQALS